MDFNTLKEKYKDNEDFMSDLSQIESDYNVLSEKKSTAVEKEQKYRTGKQEIAKMFDMAEDTPLNDLISTIGDKLGGYKREIDSFKNNASSKEIENANVKEQLSTMAEELSGIKGQLDQERATNTLNSIKSKAREALANERITDPKIQDMVINANLDTIKNLEDYGNFAKAIATETPGLTQSVHKPGSGSNPSANNYNEGKTLSNTDPKDAKARTAAIQARLEAQGLV
jgi:hypothetical protein